MEVPVLSAAWPGTHTALGMALPVPATAPAWASAGSVGKTFDTATLLCSVWVRARVKRVSGGPRVWVTLWAGLYPWKAWAWDDGCLSPHHTGILWELVSSELGPLVPKLI